MTEQKTILVSACGSSIGLEVLRSLHQANLPIRVIGTEVSWWGKRVAQQYCDQVLILPHGNDPNYLMSIKETIAEQSVDLVFINTEPELEAIVDSRDEFGVVMSCPAEHGLRACLNKQVLHDRLAGRALTAATMVVHDQADLERAIETLGIPFWLRCAEGPRGRGSMIVEHADDGMFWMDYWRRRDAADDVWLAHEYLPGRNLNWTSVWRDGELIAAACGERLKYFLSQVAVSGVTGNVSHCQLVDSSTVTPIASQAVRLTDEIPHGIYAVDLKEDNLGVPKVTEINARQAFRPLLYTQAGINFSELFVKVMLWQNEDEFDPAVVKVGLEMIRGMDFEPIFREPKTGGAS
ncbi:MAG: hypothetical protein CMJ76_16150 [Planctomycetaceae bacterium]|nr:hypothetical protein [Planctomycetaceae bacterium]|tara:strand:+ start:2217 stop:3266 length:1050 start_codon:yes stop_codon:yes gene_type:complete